MTATLPELDRSSAVRGRGLRRRARAELLPGACLLFYAGQGLAGPCALLYLTGPVHLPVASVGACMTASGVVGLLAAVPAGRICDRARPEVVLAAAFAVMASAALAYLTVHTLAAAAVTACLYDGACQSAYTARGALAARIAPQDPARLNARLYRIGNIGYALATPLTGLAAADGRPFAYRLALIGAAGSLALAALATGMVRPAAPAAPRPRPGAATRPARPWRDRRYLVFTLLYAVTSLQFVVVVFALPLWVVEHTRAPRAMVGAAALIATLAVVALQPTATRRVSDTRRASWAMAAAGITAGAGCLALDGAGASAALPAAVLLALGALALAVAEVCQAVGTITLSYRLAPASATGAYQGFAGLGLGAALAAGPALLSRTVLRPGPGWLGAAALLAAAGLLVPALVRERGPEATTVTADEPGGLQ